MSVETSLILKIAGGAADVQQYVDALWCESLVSLLLTVSTTSVVAGEKLGDVKGDHCFVQFEVFDFTSEIVDMMRDVAH